MTERKAPSDTPFDRPVLTEGPGKGYEILEGHRVYHKGSPYPFEGRRPYFKVDAYRLKHLRYDGKDMEERREVFERGDSVGVLLYNRDRRVVIVIEQFRLATLYRGNGTGWIIETIAGEIPVADGKPSETPEQAAIREVKEEAGYTITRAEPISEFFSSPGGTSEKIHLFFAEVSDQDQTGRPERTDTEDVKIVELTLDELARRLVNRELIDPKLVIASYYLQARLGLRIETDRTLKSDEAADVSYTWPTCPDTRIGIKTGDILEIKGVDIWMNPENRYMMMSRIIDEGLSASIRWGGARKYSKSKLVAEDTIGNAVRLQMGGRSELKYNEIIETDPGELRSLGVRRLLHLPIAQAKGPLRAREGLRANRQNIKPTVVEALKIAHEGEAGKLSRFSRQPAITSVLIPLIGAGEGGITARHSVAEILAGISEFLDEYCQKTRIKQFYLLAFKERELEACKVELQKHFQS